MSPKQALKIGNQFPFDASDEWKENDSEQYEPDVTRPDDPAYCAARGVICDLTDRRGIKQGFMDLDEDVRKEIVKSLAAIIRESYKTESRA